MLENIKKEEVVNEEELSAENEAKEEAVYFSYNNFKLPSGQRGLDNISPQGTMFEPSESAI